MSNFNPSNIKIKEFSALVDYKTSESPFMKFVSGVHKSEIPLGKAFKWSRTTFNTAVYNGDTTVKPTEESRVDKVEFSFMREEDFKFVRITGVEMLSYYIMYQKIQEETPVKTKSDEDVIALKKAARAAAGKATPTFTDVSELFGGKNIPKEFIAAKPPVPLSQEDQDIMAAIEAMDDDAIEIDAALNVAEEIVNDDPDVIPEDDVTEYEELPDADNEDDDVQEQPSNVVEFEIVPSGLPVNDRSIGLHYMDPKVKRKVALVLDHLVKTNHNYNGFICEENTTDRLQSAMGGIDSILEGVEVDGDTNLHVVYSAIADLCIWAANMENQSFMKDTRNPFYLNEDNPITRQISQ